MHLRPHRSCHSPAAGSRTFDVVLLVVVGVGGLCVQLHRSLAVHVAGVAHRDGRRKGVGVAVVVQFVKVVLIARVGQTVAEGEADLLGVVPAVGRGLGANRGIGVALTEDGVLVAGLVVAVADVDALVIADKAVACRAGVCCRSCRRADRSSRRWAQTGSWRQRWRWCDRRG